VAPRITLLGLLRGARLRWLLLVWLWQGPRRTVGR